MSLQDHDKSAMHRELLRDLEALIVVWRFLVDQGHERASAVWREINALIEELWHG